MFSIDSRIILVSQEGNGTIRAVEAGVQTDILDVRISRLSLDRISDPEQALIIVLGTPEVQSFIHTRGIGHPFKKFINSIHALSGANAAPATEGPAISGELKNVTLQALDYILKAFPGFWVYQNCESLDGQRGFSISVYSRFRRDNGGVGKR